MPTFSTESQTKLASCHPDLQRLFREVIKHRDCLIIEGHRSPERQGQLYAQGVTRAKAGQSKHNAKPSNAVDVMPYPLDWTDVKRTREFAGFVMGVAAVLGIDIRWGGHFKSLVDCPHYELR